MVVVSEVPRLIWVDGGEAAPAGEPLARIHATLVAGSQPVMLCAVATLLPCATLSFALASVLEAVGLGL